MENNNLKMPSYLFEVSWEVCNKVGGIHTVVSTKALNMVKEFSNNHILIGPDVWRETEQNPEFIDDQRLFKSWRKKAAQDGLRIKVGRWNVAGKPIVILVDFSTFISQKDAIFASFWEKYKLDSISGQWDYIEPALFGYAAGKVIESFVSFNASIRQRIVAQFHEWMTGSGLLYLKYAMPQVGCVFTTHATVLGRCVAGNNLPLYSGMKGYSPDELARRFNVLSKQSLERCSAQNADCFTTVSDITAKECEHFLGKPVDIVTPNGFENVFTPADDKFSDKRNKGREKLLRVAQSLLACPVSDDSVLVGISGRYEYKNKGIDVFIEALGKLNKDSKLKKDVIAFVLVPAGNVGPNSDLLNNLKNPNNPVEVKDRFVTHYLENAGGDPVMNALAANDIHNSDNDKVKVIFVPVYLQGDDKIFDIPYYDLLIGLDVTVFPSYYEPWGYTPLESLAFRVPTITTDLAGFGLWVEQHCKGHDGCTVINRTDNNAAEVSNTISEKLLSFCSFPKDKVAKLRDNAKEVSSIALWDNLVEYYYKAYTIAIDKVNNRLSDSEIIMPETVSYIEKQLSVNNPSWVSVMIHRAIPEKLLALEEIAKNLWWCWNDEARDVFRMVDLNVWRDCHHNPIALLDSISLNRYAELEKDAEFVAKLQKVYADFKQYMEGKKHMSGGGVAYFSMEYALHTSLKIYSGGLGVLAGDYLKEASDKSTKMTAVGLLYRYGYFTQKLSAMGDQEAEYEAQDFMKLPISPVRDKDGNWESIVLSFPGRNVTARIWRVDVGRVELYLLDTDFEDNTPEDQCITHHLYGGDWENRLKQELLLGLGGIRLLRKLGIEADTYHCNEGHAAFTGLERLREYISQDKLTFDEAMEVVRCSSLFTTHTPVPAGHDAFSENMLRSYISHYSDRLQIPWERLLGLGKINVADPNEKFSMSFLAANLAQEVNGVSMLHGKVSQEIFKCMWPGYTAEELHISYVTNGVHYDTWTAPEWKAIHSKVFGKDFHSHHYNKDCFDGIYTVDDKIVWETRSVLRKRLIDHIKTMLASGVASSYFTPRQIVDIRDSLRDDILTIGFARRFATYKRAHLLFRNLDSLNDIVNNPQRPVQFVFAGKAHPADKAGQDLIKRIVEVSKDPRFIGKIIFLPNYDMDLAKKLVQGVDVWMNTPTRPLEASGTSGEKAAMNGVMHFSVLDGWWVEGYRPDSGWMLPEKRTYENQNFQDELDSEMIYDIIDDDIAPTFYDVDKKLGYSPSWIQYIKNTIAKVASNFTTNRMLIDYENKYYIPLSKRYHEMIKNHFEMATNISEWKLKVAREWDNIELDGLALPNKAKQIIALGKTYSGDVSLRIGDLDKNDLGVELVVAERKENNEVRIKQTYDFKAVSQKGDVAQYHIDVTPDAPGMLMLAIRIFPKNPLLPHRQDFALVKWL